MLVTRSPALEARKAGVTSSTALGDACLFLNRTSVNHMNNLQNGSSPIVSNERAKPSPNAATIVPISTSFGWVPNPTVFHQRNR